MKIQIVTVGEPKLQYAKLGWQEYITRLGHYHNVMVTHIADKHAYNAEKLLSAASGTYKVALVVDAQQYSSQRLADFLENQATQGRVVSFLIGGSEGLPQEVIRAADMRLGLSSLTFPHDLAMLVLAEALYRTSTINAGQKYHK